MPKPNLWFSQSVREAASSTHLFEQHSRILFDGNGSYRWQSIGDDGPWQSRIIGDKAVSLVAVPGKRMHVSGVVKGKVLVYSPLRIVIEGNLIYSHGKDSDSGNDFLGLVSDKNIVVAKASVTGTGDLEIHAAIYARGRFLIRNSNAGHSGTLSIFGSLSAGSLSATEPRFATRIIFDKRLEDMRPPNFPMTDQYQLASGENQWHTQPEAEYER